MPLDAQHQPTAPPAATLALHAQRNDRARASCRHAGALLQAPRASHQSMLRARLNGCVQNARRDAARQFCVQLNRRAARARCARMLCRHARALPLTPRMSRPRSPVAMGSLEPVPCDRMNGRAAPLQRHARTSRHAAARRLCAWRNGRARVNARRAPASLSRARTSSRCPRALRRARRTSGPRASAHWRCSVAHRFCAWGNGRERLNALRAEALRHRERTNSHGVAHRLCGWENGRAREIDRLAGTDRLCCLSVHRAGAVPLGYPYDPLAEIGPLDCPSVHRAGAGPLGWLHVHRAGADPLCCLSDPRAGAVPHGYRNDPLAETGPLGWLIVHRAGAVPLDCPRDHRVGAGPLDCPSVHRAGAGPLGWLHVHRAVADPLCCLSDPRAGAVPLDCPRDHRVGAVPLDCLIVHRAGAVPLDCPSDRSS